jgi:hypothetical protein
VTGLRILLIALAMAVSCHRGGRLYPPSVRAEFEARCTRELWPGRLDVDPPTLARYCECLLRRQESRWDLERFTRVWVNVDAGAYTQRGFLGMGGGARLPGAVRTWMADCKVVAEAASAP